MKLPRRVKPLRRGRRMELVRSSDKIEYFIPLFFPFFFSSLLRLSSLFSVSLSPSQIRRRCCCSHTTRMKIRGSVVSLCFIFPHPSEDEEKKKNAVLTLTRIIKSVVTGQALVTLELRNTPGNKHIQTKGGTRIYHS